MTNEEIIALVNDPKVLATFILLAVWSLAWKGFALWRASKNNSKYWFVALLFINTYGLLEIIYLFYFSKRKKKTELPKG